ncbi:MAG TPA: hypothetical protein VGS19_23555 [Streptosporangiaceae bacterium]|nr:hypothetical protein [Streptosporangiaceae bacterium]
MADDQTRYWAALNSLRASAAVWYTEVLDHQSEYTARLARPWDSWLGAIAIGVVALALAVVSTVSGIGWPLWGALAYLIAALLFFVGALSRSAAMSRREDLAAYEARSAERERWRGVLAGLTQDWHGTLESTGVEPAVRFLTAHWPSQAPWQLLTCFGGAGEDRLTVTGTVSGLPALLQVVDFWQPHPARTPPVLFLLVACARAPAGSDPPALEVADASARQRLAQAGLSVQTVQAGAWVCHDGPATALLSSADALHELAGTVVELCRESPASDAVPPVGTADYPADSHEVAGAFLDALTAHDATTALAYLDPKDFGNSDYEPRPQHLAEPIDRRRAWPVRYPPIPPYSAKPNRNPTARYDMRADFDDGPGHLRVNLVRRGSRWVVSGYLARGWLVFGWDDD